MRYRRKGEEKMTVAGVIWVCCIVIASVALLYNNSELERWFWKKFIIQKL